MPPCPSPRDDHPSSSPESIDFDLSDFDPVVFDLPDFDPVEEWLVDPYPDLAPMSAVAEPVVTAAVVPGKPMESSIDEKMEKVSLVEISGNPDSVGAVGSIGDMVPTVGDSGGREGAWKGDAVSEVCSVSDSIKVARESEEEEEEEESSESETEESENLETSSFDSSSSSSEEEEDDVRTKGAEVDEALGLEEGEIREPCEEGEMVMSSDEEAEVPKGPIKSKHEIQDLPPVPQVEVLLEPHHQMLPVGVISSILGPRVIVEGSEKHTPLSESSILWIIETRSPLGLVDEIFGPVKGPYYVVRYNSDKEVPAGICIGTAVSFVTEFANHVLNEKNIYKKGYDASAENDEEVTEEVEFSDDEKEAEYRRSLRQSKRAPGNTRHEKQEAAYDRRTNFKGGSPSDKNRTNLKGSPWNGRLHKNQQPAINIKTDFKGLRSNDSWRSIQGRSTDKRANVMGAPVQICPQPPVPCATEATHLLPSVSASIQAPTMPTHFGSIGGTSFGSGNAFGSNPSTPAHFGFSDPSQQLLLQQINALMALLPPQQLHMVSQGGYPMNVLPTPHHQNQVFNGFPNAAPCQQPFIPNIGAITNLPWLGGLQNLSIGPTPLGQVGQSNVGQSPFGCGNVHEQGAIRPFNAQSYGQPPITIYQGGMHPMQFNPSIRATSLGAEGQPNAGQGQGASGSSNPQSYPTPRPSFDQGTFYPMPFNPSIGSAASASLRTSGQSSISQDPLGCCNVLEQGSSGSQNAESSKQHQSTINQASPGQAPFSNMQEQGASGSFNVQSYPQLQPSSGQGGMHPPMQFNSPVGPTSLGPVGQSSTGQTSFGCCDTEGQGASGPCNSQSYVQPLSSTEQGKVYPPTQFNFGRSSVGGRNPYQRGGRRGRHFFGRGGRPQNSRGGSQPN